MSKQAHLADGTVLEFPDETSDAVIDRVVKQRIAQSRPQQQAPQQPKPRTWGDWFNDVRNATVNNVAGAAQGLVSIPDAVTHAAAGAMSYGVQGAGHLASAVTGDKSYAATSDRYASALNHPVTIGGLIERAAPTPQSTSGQVARFGAQLLGGALPGAGATTVQNAAERLVGVRPVLPGVNALSPAKPTVVGRVANAFTPSNPNMTGARLVAKKLGEDNVHPFEAAQEMQTASANGQPLMLADMGDNTRALAADVARQPGTARDIGLNAVRDRQIGDNPFGTNTVPSQSQRVQTAISRDLGPVTDPIAASQALHDEAKAAAGPLYDKAYQAPGALDFHQSIADLMNRPSMQKALQNARAIAAEEGRKPEELGFIVDDTGQVGLAPQTGRYQPVAMGNPSADLPRTSVRTYNGGTTSKVGPTDLVGWLRQNGGLRDQNGELGQMGLNNAARRGMPFVGQEARFGPLVHNNGRTLDDAAHAAWEAGYFPHLSDRPSVNEFLDALRGTHEGWNRHFLPEDQGIVEQFAAHTEQNNALRDARFTDGSVPVRDTSVSAGQFDYQSPPPEAYGQKEVAAPTWQTFDYIKRGLDDVVEGYRDPTSGKLNLDTQGRAVNNTLRDFLSRVDQANSDYAAARAAYAGPASMKEALNTGNDALNWPANQIRARVSNMSQAEKDQFWLGMRSALAQKAAEANDGVNVVRTLVGSGAKRDALAEAAGGKANLENFMRSLEREQQMNVTYNKVTGGSTTAGNLLENQSNNAALGIDAAGHFGRGGGVKEFLLNHGIRQAQGAMRYGAGQAGQRAREDAASLLFTSNPNDFLKAMNQVNTATLTANQRGQNALLGALPGATAAATTGIQASTVNK
jgi:hypothetical protein